MTDSTTAASSVTVFLPGVLRSLRKDFVAIFLIAILTAGAGAVVGKWTNRVFSSAQLVLSPMPLSGKNSVRTVQGKQNEDPLEALLATPLDVKSTSLLCMSDEVLQKTFDQVNANAALSAPIANLTLLKQALAYQLTVEKETPYDVTYSPLLVLTAETKVPSDAKLIVNTWARTLVEASKKFQDATQVPVAKALDERTEEVHKELVEAEMASEKFWAENSTMYLEARLAEIVTLISDLNKIRFANVGETVLYNSMADGMAREQALMKPAVTLEITPPEKLAAALGIEPGTKAPQGEKAAGETTKTFSFQWINPAYWGLQEEMGKKRGKANGKEQQAKVLEKVVADLEKERMDLQKVYAVAVTGKTRVGRDLLRLEDVFRDIATKRDFAHVASSLNHPALQLISEGAEWPLPRFRRAITLGFASGVLGLLAAGCLSILYRMVLKPALEG